MIEFLNVSKTYKQGYKALSHTAITIDDGEFVFIMGRNGAGKSTFLSLILKEQEPTEGEIYVDDYDLGRMPRRFIPRYRRGIGVVFQDFRLLEDRNVYDNVAFAQRVTGVRSSDIRLNVPEALRRVGLSTKYKLYPDQLSGGEKQKAAIARAIVNEPHILLCDEPTGNLDPAAAEDIMELLYKINRSGTTVIVVTHSREITENSGKRIITFEKGVVVSDTGASARADR